MQPLTTAKGKYQLKDSTCAEIILKQGEIIEAKISKITENSIEYIKCGTTQPVYEVGKDKVLMIKYPDGRTEKFSDPTTVPAESTKTGKTGAIISFVLSLVGLPLLSLGLGLTGIIWGAISLGRLNKSNAKGKGFAISAIAIGALDVILGIIVLIAYLA